MLFPFANVCKCWGFFLDGFGARNSWRGNTYFTPFLFNGIVDVWGWMINGENQGCVENGSFAVKRRLKMLEEKGDPTSIKRLDVSPVTPFSTTKKG